MKRDKRTDFAQNVFDDVKMRKYLPRSTYKALIYARENYTELNQADKDIYANALCRWALKNGVTRYTHWFQPLNNFTAEKRNSLYSVDKERNAVVKFRGKELSLGEGDASSFPNGGIRQTFEARGITRWDYTSYAFIKDGCLCIPTTFSSNNCEILDKKSPLINSCKALDMQAVRILKALGEDVKHVYSVVGAEQEYFLIDKELFYKRKDLIYTGRTLFGAEPPKGQEFEDHYFRPLSKRIAHFMESLDDELWKLGILVHTEHNEVAPCQLELAPCYTRANLACDHNQLTMETLKKVASEHGFACLLHEKPFAHVNGSGKHNNWSLLTDGDENLLEVGDTGRKNARFLLFLSAVIKAVDDYSELLVASVSSHGNDCRLGGYEAPPKVLTVFLDPHLTKAIQHATTSPKWRCGIDSLPLICTATDRNRTSPFAYTGNKFEFRMVGSSASISDVNTVVNTAVAESMRVYADRLENSTDIWQTVRELITETFTKHKRIIFEGDNYSEIWAEEAKLRNLKNISTVCSIENLSNAHNVNLLEKHSVLSHREVLARQQVLLQNYVNTAKVESNVASRMYLQQIEPWVEKYIKELTDIIASKSNLGIASERETNKVNKISKLLKQCATRVKLLKKHLRKLDELTILQQAHYCENNVVPILTSLRKSVDRLEKLIPSEYWAIPTYGQLLFDEYPTKRG
ncbi:MAG: glutamine synthetase III [Clostridiales bacterium]|nr:glutamine synthetase III [Clostridiales bacterium]